MAGGRSLARRVRAAGTQPGEGWETLRPSGLWGGFPRGSGRPEMPQARSFSCRRGVFLTRWNSESI